MRSLNRTILRIFILVAPVFFAFHADAQCKRFTKKNCLPALAPYIHNGKLTSAVFNPGESADVEMTFNAGKQYRVLVCSQETVGNVQFKVLDKTRKILFESKEDQMNPSWDFKMATTQQLIIQVSIPQMEESVQKTNLVQNGCVAIMVGVKN
ncbi:MAG: hypothetical protein KDD41_02210 [Flavobacteriales bacterium]|nr:hypothetical protein [Flavobacteriales bacterium]